MYTKGAVVTGGCSNRFKWSRFLSVVMFPPAFVDRMKELGLDTLLYEKRPRKSVHILRNEEEIVNSFGLEPVEWVKHCFWVDDPRRIQEKYYDSVFVQDAASVVPVLALDVDEHCRVVDLCAAPGSKTLHLARRAHYVIANDSNRKRLRRLQHNVKRFDIKPCEVVCRDGRKLRLNKKVDRILVDAPCSGEGMVGKSHKALAIWSLKRIKKLSQVQKQLVLNGLSLLKDRGVLVYCTCTFAPEENEGVVNQVLAKGGAELECISIKYLQYTTGLTSWKGEEYCPTMEKTIRVYPFHNGTNGFFVAKLRKKA